MTQKKEQRLNIEWDEIFPGEELDVAGCKVQIVPLGIKQRAQCTMRLRTLGTELAESGVTWENYSDPSSLISLTSVILEKCPDLLAEASSIAQEDIERLPLEYAVLILEKVIAVNTKSKSVLEKNFGSLAGTIAALMTPSTSEK